MYMSNLVTRAGHSARSASLPEFRPAPFPNPGHIRRHWINKCGRDTQPAAGERGAGRGGRQYRYVREWHAESRSHRPHHISSPAAGDCAHHPAQLAARCRVPARYTGTRPAASSESGERAGCRRGGAAAGELTELRIRTDQGRASCHHQTAVSAE